VTVINVLIIVMIAGWIIRSVTSGLRAADRFATNLAEGNLSEKVEVNSRDEIAEIIDHMNTARDSLRNTLRHIGDASQQLASAAEETSAVSEQTDRGVARQMQEIEQVAAAMNEMTSTVEEVARNASDASQSAQSSNDSAKHGQTILGNAVNAVGILSDEIRQSSDTIDSLKAESEEIGKVLDVIGAIADQTNLLALNAAIEAARAGEHGRGFAVVAEEVRALASRTQGSTEEIHGMIDRLQSRSTAAVAAMQRAHDQVDHSTQAMSETEAALGEIAHGVSGINDLNFQIASAAEQQSAVAEEINRNVQTISQISEESAQGATQTKTASAELARLAEELQSRIAGFRL
jgi:methyl-accepting chemotaxis protein